MSKIRTRFAPSPTGDPHLGNLRSALFAWLFARHNNGDFIIRIEDTDKTRFVPGATERILEALEWLSLDWDEGPVSSRASQPHSLTASEFKEKGDLGPYFQSKRLDIYKKYALELVEKGRAYWCDCTPERLIKMRKKQQEKKEPPIYDGKCRRLGLIQKQGSVIRLKIPREGETSFQDLIRGKITFQNKLIDDQVLLKSDGFPTYHLANVVDDYLMKISHVIRAEEWLSSTPKHLILYKAFNWQAPEFAHLPMILGADKSKLSKRHGAVSILEYKKQGYLREAMLNFLALLGWNPGGDKEVFSKQELIKEFSLEKVQKAGAVFNQEKLDWLNGIYIRQMSTKDLLQRLKGYLAKNDKLWLGDAVFDLIKRIELVKDRMRKLSDFAPLTDFIRKLPDYDSALLIPKKSNLETTKKALNLAHQLLNNIIVQGSKTADNIQAGELRQLFDKMGQCEGLSRMELLWPLRVALTGQEKSPDVFGIAEILENNESLKRIEKAIKYLR